MIKFRPFMSLPFYFLADMDQEKVDEQKEDE